MDEAAILLSSEFTSHSGNKVRLSAEPSKALIVYFYPRAMTPGCTREAQRFNELLDEFTKCGVAVYGVSTDPPERNHRFREKLGLRFTLLTDRDGEVSSRLGILKKGVKKPSSQRVTYIMVNGKVVEVLRNVRPAERHADLALERIKSILGC